MHEAIAASQRALQALNPNPDSKPKTSPTSRQPTREALSKLTLHKYSITTTTTTTT
eukprot:CAMPEP_0174705520 /NCGR_PEP_ID=MMETSP1094-20130205/8718_1 /TAXON_ID=156173 /ORGANISM="Chrysochromulina brevifilum, Strain UTEX LB 985" /LENGTH=55 /DNA_ID=CAMNT_0015903697 /DNA_START=148 /DNA_END=311 /DNA_ORIENTATION=-